VAEHAVHAVGLLALFAMWAVMMAAMMAPSAAPLVLAFARVNRRQSANGVAAPAAILLAGYLLAWTGFSLVAALLQLGLHGADLLSHAMASNSTLLSGLLLAAAGLFQFSPLKRACLARCRSPFGFLVSDWRDGHWGALLLGLKHGAYCVGCCWMLMLLPFVAGVMNLLWMAAIAALVVVEKVTPKGDLIGRLAGAALIAAGVALIGAWGAAALLLWGAGLSLREALDKRSPLSLYLNDCLNHTGKPQVPHWAPIPPSCSPKPIWARPRPRSSTPRSGAWRGRAMRR
jgi:predicted metal-binding membrane protein